MFGESILKKGLKLIAVMLLALAMIVVMMPAASMTAYAETEVDVNKDGFKIHVWYSGGGASVAVKEYTGSGTQVILPTTVTAGSTAYPAGKSGNWWMLYNTTFRGNTKIVKVAVPNGYDTIEANAFNGCTNLKEVAIGDSVSHLGNGAFTGCPAVTYFFKGENVTEDMVISSGIGTDAEGNPIAGVIVWTKAGSNVDKAIQTLNQTRPDGKKITIKYDNDPYSKNTVKPDANGSGGGGTATDNSKKLPTVEKKILATKSEGDLAGSTYALLQAKAGKVTKNSVKLTWKKVAKAKKYYVYGNKCGNSNKYKKIKAVTGKTFTQKKLKKGTYYKYVIVAVDASNNVLATSKTIHAATTGGKVGNSKSVTVKAKVGKKTKAVTKVTVKKGKTLKLKASAKAASKKLKVKKHRAIAFESSNTKVAKVTKAGKVKGVKKGSCYVYAYAQNGVCKAVKVTVK